MAKRRLSTHEHAVLELLAGMAVPVRGTYIADYIEQQGRVGWWHLRSGTYGTLAVLQRDGLVNAYWWDWDDKTQRHRRFEITPEGRALLAAPPASEDTHVV